MIADMIASLFAELQHVWKIGSDYSVPTAEDVQTVLDEAAKVLYDRPVGDRFEMGGIIIERRPGGFQAYVSLGYYV